MAPSLLGLSTAFILYSIPLVLGRVPRNRWYGIRTPEAMQGTGADWYSTNRKGGLIFLTLGLAALIASLIVFHIST